MKILRATHLGMCFGVRDALQLALDQSAVEPLTILGDLVHNESVLDGLRERGVQMAGNPDAVTTQSVMITAHGASHRTIDSIRDRGLNVIEATCPLVHAAHRAVGRLVNDGFHPVIIGKRDHAEVRGLTGDLAEFDVVIDERDVAILTERARFGIAAQTTQPIDRVRYLIRLIAQRFPRAQIRFADTVCQPTKQRQTAAIDMARKSDVVIVIGGAHSNNTRELVQTCSRFCRRIHHVQSAADLRADWFIEAETVGVTAGTSTPDILIEGVEKWLRDLAASSPPAADRTTAERAMAIGV
jgi:4-hydroxy-3-methylbut-2-enyl diphosphate reductase